MVENLKPGLKVRCREECCNFGIGIGIGIVLVWYWYGIAICMVLLSIWYCFWYGIGMV